MHIYIYIHIDVYIYIERERGREREKDRERDSVYFHIGVYMAVYSLCIIWPIAYLLYIADCPIFTLSNTKLLFSVVAVICHST